MVERNDGELKDKLGQILGINPHDYRTAINDFFYCIDQSREINPLTDEEWEFTLANPYGDSIATRVFTRISHETHKLEVVVSNAAWWTHTPEQQKRLEEISDSIEKLLNIPCVIGGNIKQ